MNGLTMMALGIGAFVVAYFTYGKFLSRLFGVDPGKPTPAHEKRDGVDYIPTNPMVLFGHHFASIAGAGPIIGPVAAAYFGWMPVLAWIIIGCIFVGAMHDFAALFLRIWRQARWHSPGHQASSGQCLAHRTSSWRR